jgi:hypothetical protein
MPDGTPDPELDPVRAWRLGWDVIPCTHSELDEARDEERDEIDSLPRAAVSHGYKLYER